MLDYTQIPESLASGRLTIDRDAIAANWTSLKDMLKPGATCAATIKADAYGTGAAGTAKRLREAGCTTFCVALPAEGVEVRQAVPDATIYVLDGLFPNCAQDYVDNGLIPVMGSLPEIEEWAAFCRQTGTKHDGAIHVDTGMNRLGLRPDGLAPVMDNDDLAGAFTVRLIITHLVCGSDPASPMNQQQLATFRAATDPYSHIPRSMSNSAGVLMGHDFHFDLARPGIALYGGKTFDTRPNTMKPVVKVEARIMATRMVPAGETVGYSAAQTTKRDTRVAVIGAGYADGMLRLAGSADGRPGGYAFVNGHKVPLIGRISMDMMAIDVTDVPETEADRGTFVEIIGPNVAASDLAAYAETIDYEYLTSLGDRYLRRYGPLTI